MEYFDSIGKICEGIYLVDSMTFNAPRSASVFVISGQETAVLDTGMSYSTSHIFDTMIALGIDPRTISYIIPTHAHMDHAGGAFYLLREVKRIGNDGVKIACSSGCARLLSRDEKVSKLIEGMKMLSSEADTGEMSSISEEDIMIIEDGSKIDLGKNIQIEIIETPGHTKHDISILEPRNKFLFSGDSIGIYYHVDSADLFIPTSFYPDFHFGKYIDSMKKLIDAEIKILSFAHFGGISGENFLKHVLFSALELVKELHDRIKDKLQEGKPIDTVSTILKERCADKISQIEWLRSGDGLFNAAIHGIAKNISS